MTKNFLITVLFLSISIGLACGTQKTATTNEPHSGMNHDAANQDAMDHRNMDHPGMSHAGLESSPNAANAPYDLQFLDTMTAHHQGAVEMAQMVEERTARAQMKTLAKNIIGSQRKEIDKMESWRETWFPGAGPALNMEMAGMSDSMGRMDMRKLESLDKDAFDIEFVRQMIPHHEGAVLMASEALQKSQKAEIKTLAKQIVEDQKAEIKEMNEWLAAWNK